MGEIGGACKYLYWSDRRIRAIAEDNGIKFKRNVRSVFRSPSGPLLPQAEFHSDSPSMSRHEIAERVQLALGSLVVKDLVTPPPVRFTQGCGTITLAEFRHRGTDQPPSAMAATATTIGGDARRLAAICLFGSLENFADFITDATPQTNGWTSSSAPAVIRSLTSRYEELRGETVADTWPTWYGIEPLPPDQLANEAAKIAFRQGQSTANAPDWKRGFTYGQVNDVGEWLAEVYVDVEFPTDSYNGLPFQKFHRVLVGAPLWIRTPTIRALRLYDEYTPAELSQF